LGSNYIDHGVLNPVVDQREEMPNIRPYGVMDRDSTGETPSVVRPRQAADYSKYLESGLEGLYLLGPPTAETRFNSLYAHRYSEGDAHK